VLVRGLPALPFLFFLAASAAAPAQAPEPEAAPIACMQRPLSTTVSAAAADFDRGLTLLYAFNPEEARVAFRRAGRADPKFALAWWGIAMTHGPNINLSYDSAEQSAGHAAILKARDLEGSATPVERALIEAAAARFAFERPGDADRSARAYRDAMAGAATAFPLDDDVQTLAEEAEMDVHPWSYFNRDGTATAGTPGLIARLQTVLARDPGHIGANHFLIHAFEESPHPEEALAAARRLAAMHFEPAAEHLIHMPAHTFMRVGAYHEAGDSNARAIDAYRAYLASGPAGHAEYYGHDCIFGVDAFMMSGEYGRARSLAGLCRQSADGQTALVDWRFRRWDALAADDTVNPFLRGMLALHGGRPAAAQTEVKTIAKVSDTTATIEAALLEGAIAGAHGDVPAQIAALRRAVAAQDTFGYSEPPVFFFPAREALGGALLRAGRDAEAEAVFQADLEADRENPRSLYGLAEALDGEGRTADAEAARARFERAWAHADSILNVKDL
jgi:tetratricopeptide (TPR) repeat protein